MGIIDHLHSNVTETAFKPEDVLCFPDVHRGLLHRMMGLLLLASVLLIFAFKPKGQQLYSNAQQTTHKWKEGANQCKQPVHPSGNGHHHHHEQQAPNGAAQQNFTTLLRPLSCKFRLTPESPDYQQNYQNTL